MKIKKMSKKSKCTNPNRVLIGPHYLLQDFVSIGETECSTSVHKRKFQSLYIGCAIGMKYKVLSSLAMELLKPFHN